MNTKTLLLSLALFFGTAVFAQRKAVKSGTATSGTTSGSTSSGTTSTSTASSAGACYVGKKWKLTKIEKFGVEKPPGEDQKNDMLILNADGTFGIVLKGVEKSGTYTKSGSWLNLKPSDGSEALPYKIEACDATTLKADWRDGDTHNHFFYSAQ